ncbi:MAG: DUF134 domain-containing protein [Bacteroidetes bacterium]|nr:DUF134 domain-containing protein [Bacteroidota bacterium]
MSNRRGRPRRCRAVEHTPLVTRFKPASVPASALVSVILTLDELEALRLADYLGLYQEQAAERMGVSRATFGRILEAARGKTARVLIEGLILDISGGDIMTSTQRMGKGGFCICPSCDLRIPHQQAKPCIEAHCPECGKRMFREHGEHHRRYLEKQQEKKK